MLRDSVVDAPSLGGFRFLGGAVAESIGNVFTGAEVNVDEAARRAENLLYSSYTGLLTLNTVSRQPGFRPGRLVEFNAAGAVRGVRLWQLAGVTHVVNAAIYQNESVLLIGGEAWHPLQPESRAPLFVPGVIDGGRNYIFHQPVPRDRLGRVPVRFPFTPTPIGEEAAVLDAADSDYDGRVTLADYDADARREYEQDEAAWEEEEASYRAGDYDDPFPDRDDEDLTTAELGQRRQLERKRAEALRYIGYKQAVEFDRQDVDRDNYVTSWDKVIRDRDALLGKMLDAADSDGDRRLTMDDFDPEDPTVLGYVANKGYWESQLEKYHAGEFDDPYPGRDDSDLTPQELESRRAQESARSKTLHYLAWREARARADGRWGEDIDFYEGDEPGDEGYEENRRQGELDKERWPPRLPLTVAQPMAGALHGFVPAHRHGDVCRVAVHHPLWAEVIGFQYREDRPINTDIAEATSGLVVEHDTGQAWSGLVFRRRAGDADDDAGDGA